MDSHALSSSLIRASSFSLCVTWKSSTFERSGVFKIQIFPYISLRYTFMHYKPQIKCVLNIYFIFYHFFYRL